MEKNKGSAIGLAGVLVVVGIIIAVVAINSNKGDEDKKDNGGSSQQEKKDGDDKKDNKKSDTVTADDLKKVDETIAFGDYDAQYTLSKAIQNGEKLGKVVKIEGVVSNFGKGMSYNIGQRKEEGNQFIGTTFKIEDGEEKDYPADGTHVVITGIVKVDETGVVFTIRTLKNFVEVKE